MTTQDSKDWLDEQINRIYYSLNIASREVKEGWMQEVDAQTRAAEIRAEAKAAIEAHYAKELEKAVREARIDEAEGFVKLYREHWEEWEFRAAIGRRIDQLNKESD